jgi:hypothetical protein
MNKKSIIAIVVAAVVAVAIGLVAFIWSQQSGNNANTGNNDNGGSVNQSDDSWALGDVSASLESLFSGNVNRVCTYSDDETSGTMYVAGERLRVEYTSTHPDQSDGGMILKDGKVYSWDNESMQGVVMEQVKDGEDVDGNTSSGGIDEDSAFELNEDYNLNCKRWTVDQSKFNLPNNVEFHDLDEYIRQF